MKHLIFIAPAIIAFSMVAGTSTPAAATQRTQAAKSDLAAFPQARRGEIRHVIRLPKMANEDRVKVEVIVGKTMQIDCNHHMFGGALQERTAEGWGYNYYVLDNLGQGASTLMGCPNQPKRNAFVRSSSETIVRYNSRLPLVIYTPNDVQVRYRIWTAGPEKIAN